MKELRVVFSETPDNPFMNLAIEEALFISRCKLWAPDTLRIWRNKKAVVIGVFQRAEQEVDLDYAANNGIPIVRRFTSGGAVYHDLGNLNFAISTIAPSGKEKSVDYLYEELIKGVMYALEELGFNPYKENVNDVVIEDRKVVGVAGSIRGDCVFLHGAMLINTDLNILSRVLLISKKKLVDKKVSSVKYRVTNLKNVKPDIEVRDVIKALEKGFSRVLDANVYHDLISPRELELSEKLYREKYSLAEWNMERMKPFSINI